MKTDFIPQYYYFYNMKVLKFLLFPFAFLYGAVIFFRNLVYDLGIFPVKEFETGIIVIGNLSVGGTGKSPMTEYLIRLLKEKFPLATLSRGYKRHTTGFLIAENDSTSFQIGDEPLQFKKKFPDVIVSVDENRKHGIKKLLSQFPELKVILLDDGFQHRRVKAGLSILLSDYEKMFYDDFLLPVGSLREWRAGKKRADIIIVTKCPDNLSPVEKRIILKKINPEPHQQALFSHVRYGEIKPILNPSPREGLDTQSPFPLGRDGDGLAVILLTGVSNPKPLEDYLKDKVQNIIPIHYPDHHEYTILEVTQLAERFNSITSQNKIIITTEKDAMRLDKLGLVEIIGKLPVYYIPIEVTFDEKEKEEFNKLITDYVIRTNQKHSRTH
ncbi:MAG: tetraacyldisaccharide 4'-kinase [Bacteroidetes bacterium]|nr:tetraacyldisaccharide 4'-kinase [Bacteroidota bacterium]